VRGSDRAIEADDSIHLDTISSDKVMHTCMKCGAEGHPNLKRCYICDSPFDDPGQEEFDMQVHKKKLESSKLSDDEHKQFRQGVREAEVARERVIVDAELLLRQEQLASARVKLWLSIGLGIFALLVLVLVVALTDFSLRDGSILGIILIGIQLFLWRGRGLMNRYRR
jgi:hypothetical protein